MANRLAHETSPYLRQHADNPVDWFPWGAEAFAKAEREDKPVLLSVGYAACHWCHVMEHESFENPATAELMNRHFVNVKVDREERPDVDAIYMSALQAMTGHGGWPMTVVLTPDGKPFFAGTYYPPADRMGHPSFERVLRAVIEAWRERREAVVESAERVSDHLQTVSEPAASSRQVTPELIERAVEALSRTFDDRHGGFGEAPKFPPHTALRFLLRESGEHARQMALKTLSRMARGGIFDQIGGGFARYSVDEKWLVPHFEKMLYDNAHLIQRYSEAFRISGDAKCADIVDATVSWAKREMLDPAGGFYSALDADSDGEEGQYYVWTASEFDELLQEDAPLARAYYGVTTAGNFEGRNVLHRPNEAYELAARFGTSEPELERKMRVIDQVLFRARQKRTPPALDDKVLTSWNGLMIGALADAGRILDRPDFTALASRTAGFLVDTVLADGRLRHVYHSGTAKIDGLLEDYAYLGLGLVSLYRATFDSRWLLIALTLAEKVTEHFVDPESVGFYSTADDAEELIVRPKSFVDSPNPSENAAAAELLLVLGRYAGRTDWQESAETLISSFADGAQQHPNALASMLCVAQTALEPSLEVAIFGDANDLAAHAMIEAAFRYGPKDPVIAFVEDPGDPLVARAPFLQGRDRQDGKPTAFVCRSGACDLPVTTPDALAEQLQRR